MMKIATSLLIASLLAAPTRADSQQDRLERDLQRFFEGRTVTVLVDMPASSKGIDLQLDTPEPLDPSKLDDRIGESGVAIKEGTRVPITKVHLKDDLIEFQLAGGGFNWFWNSSGTVSGPRVEKTRRERDLEQEVREETDPDRRHDLERDLRTERELREAEERRARELAEVENQIRREKDALRALGMGSRFNLRYNHDVPPPAATPRGVMQALSPWIDFSGLPGGDEFRRPRHEDREGRDDREDRGRDDRDRDDRARDRSHDSGDIRAGMTWDDVRDVLGLPDREKTVSEGRPHKTIATYAEGSHHVEVTYVDDVVVGVRKVE